MALGLTQSLTDMSTGNHRTFSST